MTMTRLLGAAAVAALLSGAAYAQAPAAAAPAAKPAVATPPPAAATTPAVTPEGAAPPAATPAPAASTPVAAGQVVAKGDIVETLKADGHFTTFVKALDTANMTSVLKTNQNLTVFAPTDAAFAALPAGELDKLLKDPAALQKLLTYHVVNATVDSTKIKGAKGGVKTVAGSELMLDGSGATAMANNATIVQADVKATNGTVHIVDKVLMPGAVATASATTGATTDAAATTPAKPAPAAATATPPATPPAADDAADEGDAAPADETPQTPAAPPEKPKS